MEGENVVDRVSGDERQEEYSLGLRRPLVEYFNTHLSPIYNAEQLAVQEEGNYQHLIAFKASPFSHLMDKLSMVEDPEIKTPIITLQLSDEDVHLMTTKLDPQYIKAHVSSKHHNEIMDELKGKLRSAKSYAALKKHAAKVKLFLKRAGKKD